MKTLAPPLLRYRPPARWSLYGEWDTYLAKPAHPHKWIRVSGSDDSDAVVICVQCGETL